MSAQAAPAPYIVKGCDTPYDSQTVWPRLEINDLVEQPYQFSLFIQAMVNLQAVGYTPQPASWKELGGIHGVPWERWSGDPDGPEKPAQPDDGVKPTQWDGYCFHSSVLFPPWHRALMLCVEQAVCNEARAIVSKYSYLAQEEVDQWNRAALTLRFPYWDWSDVRVEKEGLPKVFSYERLRVLGPGNTTVRVRNPLRSYTFESPPDDVKDYMRGELEVYFKEWKRTYRWATGKYDPDEDYMQLDTTLKKGSNIRIQGEDNEFFSIATNRSKLMRVFSFPAEAPQESDKVRYWDFFTNTHPQSPKPTDADFLSSLEEPHNNIHDDIGGSGDMAFLEMAGFDPIFYMHHGNIDRLYALWEYCYPDYWLGKDGYIDDNGDVKQFIDPKGTFQEKRGTAITSESSLAPFRKPNGEYWTAEDCRGLTPDAYEKYYSFKPLEVTIYKIVWKQNTYWWNMPPDMDPIYRRRRRNDWDFRPTIVPVTVTIDVTKPCTLEERKTYIHALQVHYGLPQLATPFLDDPDVSILPPLLTYHPGHGIIPPTHEVVDGIRDFVVVAYLPQFAWPGSHRLELYLSGTYVGDVSVFSRLEPEKCENCVGRTALGTPHVRGVITLPPPVVLQVIASNGLNNTDATEEEIVAALEHSLTARLVRPNRAVIAHAEVGFGKGVPDDNTSWFTPLHSTNQHQLAEQKVAMLKDRYPILKDKHQPTLEIHSASILASKSDDQLPPIRVDWRSHKTVLKGEWRQWTPPTD